MTGRTEDDTFDEAAAAIYGAAPADFVAERRTRVDRLETAGARDVADRVGSLRKPTLAAWAVNQVALHDADLLTSVLEAGSAARDAMAGADRAEQQAAQRDLRDRVSAARDRAADHLRRIGAEPAGHLVEVEQTLTAAAIDPDQRHDVAAGRLVRPLAPPGFGALVGLPVGDRSGAAPTPTDDGDREQRRRLRDARRGLERLQHRRTRAEQDARTAEEEAARLRHQADEAERAAAGRREELEQIDDELAHLQQEIAELDGSG